MTIKTTTDQCKRQHEWRVKTDQLPKQIKRQKANIIQMRQQLTWQEIKHTTQSIIQPWATGLCF